MDASFWRVPGEGWGISTPFYGIWEGAATREPVRTVDTRAGSRVLGHVFFGSRAGPAGQEPDLILRSSCSSTVSRFLPRSS